MTDNLAEMADRVEANTKLMEEVETIVNDAAEAEGLGVPAPQHTVLEVWREILSNAKEMQKTRIGPDWAIRVLNAHPFVESYNLPEYAYEYHGLLNDMFEIIEAIISQEPECLKRVERDAEENRHLYLDVLAKWQVKLILQERAWDPQMPYSGEKLAAMSDAQEFLLGQQGLIQHLGVINFAYSEEDQELLRQAIELETEG